MLKKPKLILSMKENKLNFSNIENINEKILSKENFEYFLLLQKKDLTCFNLILKLTDNNTYSIIDFIINNSYKKYNKKKIEAKESTKYFITKQTSTLI